MFMTFQSSEKQFKKKPKGVSTEKTEIDKQHFLPDIHNANLQGVK
jgi:hypothetical protein